ncbi:hypothetical protein [Streptomyces sp. NRRL S-350]|uniref:hypothetical protein n=1 Tax=Streptomyces sp. NRRL S-350 TaxID=1463902 RepID=UPI0004BFA577|nr:hypothetical protein [Streptomyces sp. NRRL S-350]
MSNTPTTDQAADPTALLPDLPDPSGGDGYDWMELVEEAADGWRVVSGLRDGRLLGEWPYIIVTVYRDKEQGLYGVGTYTEGDIEVKGFTDRAEYLAALLSHVVDD